MFDPNDIDLSTYPPDKQRYWMTRGLALDGFLHEINTPLAGMSMSTQLLALDFEALRAKLPLGGELSDWADDFESHFARLRLSLEHLELLQIELSNELCPPLEKRVFPLADLLNNSLTDARLVSELSDITVRVIPISSDILVMVNPLKWLQVIVNLLRNARHSHPAESLQITLSASATHETVTITICDNGPGYPEALLTNTSEAKSEEQGISPQWTSPQGHGLGLWIIRQIITQHQGRIVLYNKAQGGACVDISLPRYHPPQTP